MVDDLKEFARQQRLALAPVDVHRFVESLAATWGPVADARQIELRIELPPHLPALAADEGKLRRVFDNLLKNAVEAIEHGPGFVTVRASIPDPARVHLVVEDTGPGFPCEIEPFRLFETTKPLGTGLGLAIAKEVIEAHRGTIHVDRAEPHGAIFAIDLPIAKG
jgi:signal transduction histidine kinase